MKQFLKYCIFFIFPIIVIAIPIEYLLRQIPNSYKYKYDWMQKNAEEVEILVFGSSQAFDGISPKLFKEKAFNLANTSQGLRQDSFLLKKWEKRYQHLRTVILPISYFSLLEPGLLESFGESYRCRYYKLYMDCDLYSDWSDNFELSDIRSAIMKIERFLTKHQKLNCDKYGWCAKKHSPRELLNTIQASKTVKIHAVRNWDKVDINYIRMKEMANFCRRRNIQLVLITLPCWHTYYDRLEQKQLATMYELVHHLQKEYGVSYLDYLTDSRFEAVDFSNCCHLSKSGAIKFTEILDKDIQLLRTKQYHRN